MSDVVLRLDGVTLRRGDTTVLHGVDWCVERDQRWVVLGPNGSGKTSLVSIATMWLHPSSGTVEVAHGQLGRVDVRRHRAQVPVVSASLADQLRPGVTVLDAVMTAKHAALEAWWHPYDDADRSAAIAALDRFGMARFADRTFGTLSSGERQRVLLARAAAVDAAIIFLDEPMAGLDLGAREDLVESLSALAAEQGPPLVLVTHHVDEIPEHFTHGLLLERGRVRAAGPLSQVLTAEALTAMFGRPLALERRDRRWTARAAQR